MHNSFINLMKSIKRKLKTEVVFLIRSYKQNSRISNYLKVKVWNLFFRQQRKLIKLKYLSDKGNIALKSLMRDTLSTNYRPINWKGAQSSLNINIPRLNLYRFSNAVVNSRSNAILIEDNLIVESYSYNERFNQGFVEWHDQQSAVITKLKEKELSSGLFLGGLGSFNWYHWLIEILPKALFYDQVPTKNILVDDSVRKIPSMQETLKLVIPDDLNIVYMDTNYNYKIQKLYWINAVSYAPYMLHDDKIKLTLGDFFLRKEPILELRKKVLSKVKLPIDKKAPNRYIVERSHHRVPQNQKALIDALRPFGFQPIKVELLSFQQQLEMFNSAQIIIGVSGAVFSNILFSDTKTKFICFMSSSFNEFACFSNLAAAFDIDLTYIFYEIRNNEHHYSNNFTVDINLAIKVITQKLSE